MAAIAGAVHLDGRPGDRHLVARMLRAMAHRGSDPAIRAAEGWALGSAGAFASQAATPHHVVVCHGVLYDADDLASAPGLEAAGHAAALIAAAYARWGERCAAHLRGDFACVVFDRRERRVFCVRDAVGVKPFYYAHLGSLFLFASEPRALFEHPRVGREPDTGFIAEVLSDDVRSRSATLFRDIRRLPPAMTLTFDANGVRQHRYWRPRPDASVFRAPPAELDERFREVMRTAVRRRVASHGRVAVQLSGGLDSTTIAALAGQARPASVTAFTIAHAAPGCDERAFARTAARELGIASVMVAPQPWSPSLLHRDMRFYGDWNGGPNGGLGDRGLCLAARSAGFDVILTGEGGDEWLTGSPMRYADLLAAGDVTGILRALRQAPDRRLALRRLVMSGAWPLLPASIRTGLRTIAGRGTRARPSWITPQLAAAVSIDDRAARPAYDVASGWTRASWDIAQYLEDAWQAIALETTEREAARYGLEERHPFYDTDVITFALSLPEHERFARGVPKVILRRAMAGILPDAIRLRRDKAEFSSLYLDAFVAHGGERMFADLAIADAGWVNARQLQQECRRAMDAVSRGALAPLLRPLWMAFTIELWCRYAVLGREIPEAYAA